MPKFALQLGPKAMKATAYYVYFRGFYSNVNNIYDLAQCATVHTVGTKRYSSSCK
jgi:hypothetical protein